VRDVTEEIDIALFFLDLGCDTLEVILGSDICNQGNKPAFDMLYEN